MRDSLQTQSSVPTNWQMEDGILMPSQEVAAPESHQAQKQEKNARIDKAIVAKPQHKISIPKYLAYPFVDTNSEAGVKEVTDTLSLSETDSVVSASTEELPDSLRGEIQEGIVLINPMSEYINQHEGEASVVKDSTGMSWIYVAFAALFCVVGLKFKGNAKYMRALLSDLTETRVRHNAFDDTVKETSLLVLLNIMWIACGGVMLWSLLNLTTGINPMGSMGIPQRPALGMLICMGVAGVYLAILNLAYFTVGNVFADSKETKLWLKGSGASIGLETFLLFPIALLLLGYPEWSETLLILGGIVFGIGKIIFLYKGFRIFFAQISSWLLFLYYLCSLEVVPLILTYLAALWACTSWLT